MTFPIQTPDIHRSARRVDQILTSRTSLNLPLNSGIGAGERCGADPARRLIAVIRRVILVMAYVHDQHSDDVVASWLKDTGRKGEIVGSAGLCSKQCTIQPHGIETVATAFGIDRDARFAAGRNKMPAVPDISVMKSVIIFVQNR